MIRASLYAAAVLAVLAAGWWLFEAGRDHERAITLQRSVDALRERNAVDDEVRDLSDVDLCRALGGLPDVNGQCL